MIPIHSLLPLAGLIDGYSASNGMGKAVVWVLFFGSVVAWCVMVGKWAELRNMAGATRRFLSEYRRLPHPMDLSRSTQEFLPSPLDPIYRNACKTLLWTLKRYGVTLDSVDWERHTQPDCLGHHDLDAVRGMAERVMAEQALRVERSMSILAIATTSAPFLGLLGTVWGVMDAFQGMAVTGSAMLSDVAPGISGALVTTVVGLLVALPSSIGYNLLSDRVRHLTVEMENYVEEFMSDVAHHHHRVREEE